MKGICSVSVDLDALMLYCAIHGIEAQAQDTQAVCLAMRRFFNLFDELNVSATFFVVASDLTCPSLAAVLAHAAERGHEIANHSLDHRYDLIRLGDEDLRRQIVVAHELVQDRLGVAMCGFRAPGYLINSRVLNVLEDLGYRYDASVFPCPIYFAAKAAALLNLKMRGKKSLSIWGAPAMSFYPAEPFRPGVGGGARGQPRNLLELPVAVSPYMRLPLIGSSALFFSPRLADWTTRRFARRSFVGFACHAIDLIDGTDPGVPAALVAVRPDLRKPWPQKAARLAKVLTGLARFHRFETLVHAANHDFA